MRQIFSIAEKNAVYTEIHVFLKLCFGEITNLSNLFVLILKVMIWTLKNVGEQEEKNEELDIKVFSCLRVQDIISLHHFQQKYFFKEKLQASWKFEDAMVICSGLDS